MDVATAMLLPGEHGDSATDLPFKRLCLTMYVWKSLMFWTTVLSILGSMNIVCSATLYSHFCGGIYSSSLCAMAAKDVEPLKAMKDKAEPFSTLLQP